MGWMAGTTLKEIGGKVIVKNVERISHVIIM
jgi:hypothetical protein